jgi:hypothetical protein
VSHLFYFLVSIFRYFNSQVELIRLTSEVMKSLDNWYGNIDTIQPLLLV